MELFMEIQERSWLAVIQIDNGLILILTTILLSIP